MSCGNCAVTPCIHCGKLISVRSAHCPICGGEVPRKVCPYCNEAFTGYTGDPPVCPTCGRELPKEYL